MAPAPVGALVLAAGLGRRFGSAKLLALWRGRPIVSYVLDRVTEGRTQGLLTTGLVVHRPDDFDTPRMARERGLEPHRNSRPESGMASSLRLGLNALSAERWQPLDGVLVVMADQPLLRTAVIETLVNAFDSRMDMVRPQYAGDVEGPGHPVIVHRRLWDRARSLTGDEGFRVIATWNDVRVTTVPVSGGNPDVDTLEDLARLDGQAEPP
jgi:CTP:molybdopterin cytidylyltransferase MocA